MYPDSTYIFKHALTREVVYDSILAKRKKKLHEEIGNAIEETYKDNLSAYWEVLAEHYFLSMNYLKSAEYSKFASRKAQKKGSFNDAIAQTKKRIMSLERSPQTEDVEKQIIDARANLGLHLLSINHFFETKEAIGPIIDLAIKYNNKTRLCQIYTILGTYYFFVEENFPEGFKALENALKISGEIKDYGPSLYYTYYWFGVVSSWNCEFERSATFLQRALDMVLEQNVLWVIAGSRNSLAYFCHYFPGKIDLQFLTTSEALLIAEESGDMWSKSFAYVTHGVSFFGKGLLEEAEKNLLKGLELCERISITYWITVAQFHLGELYFEIGDFSKSIEFYKKGLRVLEREHLFPSWAGVGKAGLARAKVMNREEDVDLDSLYARSRNIKGGIYKGWIRRYIGGTLLDIDDGHMPEAEAWIQKAIEADQRNRMMFHLGKDYALYAEWHKRNSNRPVARENLGRAIEIFKECGADGWVEKYEKEMSALA